MSATSAVVAVSTLLELFVTAAQQEALSDTALLTALLDEADSLGSMSKEAAMSRLHRPVLMVSPVG